MQREIIRTADAPSLHVPLSQGVRFGSLVFVSSQVAIHPHTGEFVRGDIGIQSRRVIDNVRSILEAAGTSLDQVLKVTVYLRDIDDFGGFNGVYATYFASDPPARTTVEIARLAGEYAIEMDAIAGICDGPREWMAPRRFPCHIESRR